MEAGRCFEWGETVSQQCSVKTEVAAEEDGGARADEKLKSSSEMAGARTKAEATETAGRDR